jgi:predicted deacylase
VSFTGLAPGARLIVLGAVHGNETCGTQAIRRVIAEIESGQLGIVAGSVTFVPVTNPLAYARQQRMGDRNLNRNLVPTDTPAEFEDRIANWLCPLLAQHDALLDLHSFHTAGEPFVMLGPEDNSGLLEPFARAAEETALALAWACTASSTAGSTPMLPASRAAWQRAYRRARPTCITASAPPNTCARRAASRSPSNAASTTIPPRPRWRGAPSTMRWRTCG